MRMTRFAVAAPITISLLVAAAGCTTTSTTTAAATTIAAASGTAHVTASSSPSADASPQATASPSDTDSTASAAPTDTASSRVPGTASSSTPAPFPGIWDITSWQAYRTAQAAVAQGHQPWLLDPASVVRAWAGRWTPVPTPRQIAADTFQVTQPGTTVVYTIRGTRPDPGSTPRIWVITSITHS